jgi:hypothetical protein
VSLIRPTICEVLGSFPERANKSENKNNPFGRKQGEKMGCRILYVEAAQTNFVLRLQFS